MSRPRRSRRVVVLALLALVLAALLGAYTTACWVVAGRLLTPVRHDAGFSGDAVPALLAAHDVHSLELRTADGVPLATSIVSPPPPVRGTVLLLHEKDGHRSPARMAWLAERGFRAIAPDLRAHGESGGGRTTFGIDERFDALAAARLARQRWPDDPLLAWGVSLGAAAALGAWEQAAVSLAGEPPLFDGLILESLHPDLDTAFRRRIALHLPTVLRPFGGGLRDALVDRGRLHPEPWRPVHLLARLPPDLPVLLATGEHDAHSPPEDLQRLTEAAPWAEAVVVPEAGHGELFGSGEWRQRVESFLGRW